MHIGSSSKLVIDRRRRADRRDDRAAADEHRAGRRRPHPLAGVQEVPRRDGRALRGRDRLDPVLPRAPRPHATACTRRGRAPTSARSCRARCSWSTSCSASSTTRSASSMARDIGVDRITVEIDYPHSDTTWPRAPERLMSELRGHRPHRRRDRPDDAPQRDAHLLATTRSGTGPGSSARSARSGPRPSASTSSRARPHGGRRSSARGRSR